MIYTLSSLRIITRLAGVIIRVRFLKNGAASAMLVSVMLISTSIPIISFLPRNAARSSKSQESQVISTATSADFSSDSNSSVTTTCLSPERSNAKDSIGRE